MQAGSAVEPFSKPLDYAMIAEGPEFRSQQLAWALSHEFSAPVGLLDSGANGRAGWMLLQGAESTRWPDPSMAAGAARDAESEPGGTSLWLPGPAEDHLWLILRLPESERPMASAPTVWVGFALPGLGDGGPVKPWGPAAPAQALLAWGREVVAGLRSRTGAPDPDPAAEPPRGADRGALQLSDRLIREMHISEPPRRFQRLAVELLREALDVEALSWVPRSRREPVVAAGAVAGMADEAFRLLLPSRHDQAEQLWSDGSQGSGGGVRQAIAISSDAEGARAGWLVAVNPTDGRAFGPREADLLRPVASLIATQRINARHYTELKDLLFGIIRSLTSSIDAKDPYTLGHSERVGRIAVELGEVLGLSSNDRGDLYLCGLLHDIGKIGISDAVLQKPGPLTPEEFAEIKRHPLIGVRILSDLKKLHHLLPGVAHHHENFDGTGYPDGLAGYQIPRIARILAVADAFDAMSSTRPYRRRLGPDQIDRIFRDGSGVQWDPEVVDALFRCRAKVESIHQKGLGQSVVQAVDDTIDRAKNASYIADSMVAPVGYGATPIP